MKQLMLGFLLGSLTMGGWVYAQNFDELHQQRQEMINRNYQLQQLYNQEQQNYIQQQMLQQLQRHPC